MKQLSVEAKQRRPEISWKQIQSGLQCGSIQVHAVRRSAGLLAPGLGERARIHAVEAWLAEEAQDDLPGGRLVAGD